MGIINGHYKRKINLNPSRNEIILVTICRAFVPHPAECCIYLTYVPRKCELNQPPTSPPHAPPWEKKNHTQNMIRWPKRLEKWESAASDWHKFGEESRRQTCAINSESRKRAAHMRRTVWLARPSGLNCSPFGPDYSCHHFSLQCSEGKHKGYTQTHTHTMRVSSVIHKNDSMHRESI